MTFKEDPCEIVWLLLFYLHISGFPVKKNLIYIRMTVKTSRRIKTKYCKDQKLTGI